jgi:hypothetical protein
VNRRVPEGWVIAIPEFEKDGAAYVGLAHPKHGKVGVRLRGTPLQRAASWKRQMFELERYGKVWE